ncbi:hypothetical protein GGX14DRAFT_359020 [Mycena pura]|uniref:Aminoglycoside phosphotransferase domain-containing protein n=1 Tax=Mycena pura TaxID=153505 RepID=A0AAD6YJR8_9AGAR|nr:hypothetical protein GGX14DRAFT_359020 [Mycena pura]
MDGNTNVWNERRTLQLAAYFGICTRLCREIADFHHQLSPAPYLCPQIFPRADGSIDEARLLRSNPRVFWTTWARENGTHEVVVKLMSTSRYGSAAQKKAGDFAPHLYVHRPATEDHCSGFYIAVMDRVRAGVESAVDLHRTNLIRLLQHFRTSGIVHGDLHRQNIILLEDGNVKVVDWDWAGLVDDEPCYPWTINLKNQWAPGVAAGAPIKHEHDRYQIELLFKEWGWSLLKDEKRDADEELEHEKPKKRKLAP